VPDLTTAINEFLQNPETGALLRILLAGLATALIGLEREVQGKPAGIRTYALVGIGSAAFTVVGTIGFGNGDPAARVVQGVITGIGFLGAGTIIQRRNQVVGLTTAAGIWAAAAIGVAIGANLLIVGIGAAIVVFLLLQFMDPHVLVRFGLASKEHVEGRIDGGSGPERADGD
jgi:putative Mg2+ transporter-C (MgtC) family protein